MDPAFVSLIDSKYRVKRQVRMLLWIVFLGGAAALLVGSALAAADGDVYDTNNRAGLAIFPAVIGLIAFALWWPVRSANAMPVLRLLRDRPYDAVWVHIKHVHVRNRGIHHYWLVIGDIGRKLHTVPIDQHEMNRVLEMAQRALPHATFGHDPQNQNQFYANPASLRRGPPPGPGQAAPMPQAMPAQPPPAAPPAGGGLRAIVAQQVPFAHIDHAMRSLGLTLERPGPEVAPGEPGSAAWSGSWARVTYRYEAPAWARTLELSSQNPSDLRARIAAAGLPLTG